MCQWRISKTGHGFLKQGKTWINAVKSVKAHGYSGKIVGKRGCSLVDLSAAPPFHSKPLVFCPFVWLFVCLFVHSFIHSILQKREENRHCWFEIKSERGEKVVFHFTWRAGSRPRFNRHCHIYLSVLHTLRYIHTHITHQRPSINMSAAAPADGGSNPSSLKEKMKNPFASLREKLHDTKLHDVKVGLIQKK